MYHELSIPDGKGSHWLFSLNFYEYCKSKRIEVPNVCIIDVYKFHDHRYDLKAFFYETKYITYQENIRSKKELYSAIQKLLKVNLNVAVQ